MEIRVTMSRLDWQRVVQTLSREQAYRQVVAKVQTAMSHSEGDTVAIDDVSVAGMKRVARKLPADIADQFCRHWMAAEVSVEVPWF